MGKVSFGGSTRYRLDVAFGWISNSSRSASEVIPPLLEVSVFAIEPIRANGDFSSTMPAEAALRFLSPLRRVRRRVIPVYRARINAIDRVIRSRFKADK